MLCSSWALKRSTPYSLSLSHPLSSFRKPRRKKKQALDKLHDIIPFLLNIKTYTLIVKEEHHDKLKY
jgi:hypothetical protein